MTEEQVDFGFHLRLFSQSTAGRLTIVEHPMASGVLAAPMHTHTHEDGLTLDMDSIPALLARSLRLHGLPGRTEN